MFKNLRTFISAVKETYKKTHDEKLTKKQNELKDLMNKKIQKLEEKKYNQKVESEKVTESTNKKTKTITEYTYFLNSEITTKAGKPISPKKTHGLISMMLSKHGVKISGFGRSKKGLKEEYLKFAGNTDEQNQKINNAFETVEGFKRYLHRSPRNTKEVLV